MKKLFLSILAVAALASCSKMESTYVDQDSEIKLAPVASMATKADFKKAIDGTTYPADEEFGVVAYWADEEAGKQFDEGTVYLGANGAVPFTKKGNYWGGETAYYWPKNGSLRFAAFSPFKGVDGENITATHDLASDTYKIDFVQSDNTANTVDLLVAPTTKSYNAQTATEKVSVVFEHTQSWISINVKATEAAKGVYELKKLTIEDVFTEGTLEAQMLGGKMSWYPLASEKDYLVYDGAYVVTTDVKLVETNAKGTLVIPQATTDLTIEFDQLKEGDVPALEGQSLTIPLVLGDGSDWEPGKHYIYTIIFDRDEILINPSVADWEDEYINDVPATDNEVATAEELVAAINNGGQIRLANDITLNGSTAFKLNESVNIDLNGYTLTSNIKDILFRVNDGATLTIGRGTVNSVDYIASANPGGTIVVNNGIYTTDETTLFQANGGTVYVTGGTFSNAENQYGATYLLNIIDATRDQSLVEISGGSFKGFNPANNNAENPQESFVKEGYAVVVEGDYFTVIPQNDLVKGGEVTLAADITITSALTVAKGVKAVLNLNGMTIKNRTENTSIDVFSVEAGAELTINGDGNVIAVGGNQGYPVYCEGKMTINGGNFVTGLDENNDTNACIYAKYSGEIYITGGTFKGEEGCLLINKHDATRDQSVIEITGGTYYQFDPSNCASEGAGTNFVKEGYKSTKSSSPVIVNGVLVDAYTVTAE